VQECEGPGMVSTCVQGWVKQDQTGTRNGKHREAKRSFPIRIGEERRRPAIS